MKLGIQTFFRYYGGKWRVAPRYPKPRYRTIIEPFAGTAGYSLRYPDNDIILYDKDPVIYGIWKYLIKFSQAEILSLPISISHADEITTCQEARWLVGFWLNAGTASPALSPSAWMRGGTRPNSYWGESIRNRIARQVVRIRHWKVYNQSYDTIDPVMQSTKTTWFVDPPYQYAGKFYKYRNIDYTHLAKWIVELPGQVIACEQSGADYLPFSPFRMTTTTAGKRGDCHMGNRATSYSAEVIWIK